MKLTLHLLALALGAAEPAMDIRVADPAGEPVEGARIEVVRQLRSSDLLTRLVTPAVQAETGPDGTSGLRLPAIDGKRLVLVDHPRYEPWSGIIPEGPVGAHVQLTPGEAWRGRVLFQGGQPTEGTICATWTEDFPDFNKAVTWRRCAEVGRQGHFTLEGLSGNIIDVDLDVPGYVPRRVRGTPDSLDALKLEPGLLLDGVVSSSSGQPVAGASIGTRDRPATFDTDATGQFHLVVEELPVTLDVQAKSFHPTSVLVEEESASEPIPIVLRQREAAVALVIPGDGGQIDWLTVRTIRLASARVREEEQRLSLEEEEEVRVELSGPGTYRFRFEAPGYKPVQTPRIDVGRGEVVDLGAVFLTRGAGVRGNVVDGETGAPLEGVEVELLPTGTGAFEAARRGTVARVVTAEGTGEFSVFGLEGGQLELRLRRFNYATFRKSVRVHRNRVTEVGEIALGRGVPVRGRLIGRDGEPRPGLTIRFFDPQQDAPFPIDEVISDPEGAFEGPVLAPGTYRLQVSGDRLLLSQEIAISAREAERELELVVGGTILRGVVLRDGRPLVGGLIRISSLLDPGQYRGKVVLNAPNVDAAQARFGFPESSVGASIGPDGTFSIEEAPTGLLWATVIDSEGNSHTRQLLVPDVPNPEVSVEIGGVSLRGQVLDEETGIGVEATLRLRDSLGRLVSSRRSGHDGLFEIQELEEGTYALQVAAEDYVSTTLFDVDVRQGASPLEVQLRAGRRGTLEVRLQRNDGTPISGSLATLLDGSGSMVRSLPTDGSGVRVYDDLPPGTYTLVWSDAYAGTGASSSLQVESGQRQSWNSPLRTGSVLKVQCAPELCAGAAVELLALHTESGVQIAPYLSGFSSSLRFSQTGGLTLGRLSPGRYVLTLWAGGNRFQKSFESGGPVTTISLP